MSTFSSPEVADVVREVIRSKSYLSRLSADKRRVLRAIFACRTSKLGGHINRCNHCGHEEQSYNSCWNRHCPKCRGGNVFEWVAKREADLLPVPYFHVVFTLPPQFRGICYQNKKVLYDLLFRASADALQAVAKTKLGATLGFFGVLHTWNQELEYHPHIHYVVPAGGISLDGTKWVSPEHPKFLLPVRALSKVFRGKFIEGLKKRKLNYFGDLSLLSSPREFNKLLNKSVRNDWVVYAKKPFAGPERVIKYLASYTHRVGISNHRLRSVSPNRVTFLARDKINKGKKRLLSITPQEFIRRFLLHIVPSGYRRVRYFGFLFNQRRKEKLALCRTLLSAAVPPKEEKRQPRQCPSCSLGRLVVAFLVKPHSTNYFIPRWATSNLFAASG